jgi:diguanylate cyclase (GGDEF)-like protein
VDKVTGLGVRSVLALPVINKKKTVGVLEWLNKKNGGDFTKQDLQLASRWTDQAAIVIERSNLYQVMANLAVTDDLTKLFNFRYLDQALEAEIKRCRRYKSTVSVIFLDLDRFKLVNDNHGHLMGSKTLKEVAHILVDNLRDVDIIARYGGDEFVVVLPYTPSDVAYKITLRLQRAIQQYRFLSDEGLSLNVTASFGLAGFPQHASNKTDLIRLADQAMYEAKNRGRDRIVISEPLLSSTPAV